MVWAKSVRGSRLDWLDSGAQAAKTSSANRRATVSRGLIIRRLPPVNTSKGPQQPTGSEAVQVDGFVDEHDRNVVTDGVEQLSVLADQPSRYDFHHRIAGPIVDSAGRDRRVEARHELSVREADGLFGLGT